jgi:hypothetical protein
MSVVPYKGGNAAQDSSLQATELGRRVQKKRQEAYSSPPPDGRRAVGVLEMMEFCRSLDIDPVRESDMLWIAEEAFHAKLPIGWTEHVDDNGHTYFHNLATGMSEWQHPMDDLFREIVDYNRLVKRIGGFWKIEEEVAELEEKIRNDLRDWMELFDENGEKYFFNRSTLQSRFDDPRNDMYHKLYTRIKMVAKMKERLPLLARAPKPEELTPWDLKQRRLQDEEEEAYLAMLRQLQGFGRIIIAKNRVRLQRARKEVCKGHQPLKGRITLQLKPVGKNGEKELVLEQTGAMKKDRAVTRLQARVRGIRARAKVMPMLMHHNYITAAVVKIQRRVRRFLTTKRKRREAERRMHKAAAIMTRIARGFIARRYVKKLKVEREAFTNLLRSTVMIQCMLRKHWARNDVKGRRVGRYTKYVKRIQGMCRQYLGRDLLQQILPSVEPVRCRFVLNTESHATFHPWSFRVLMAPIDQYTRKVTPKKQWMNLFANVGAENIQGVAATHIQKMARGYVARRRDYERKEAAMLVEQRAKEAEKREFVKRTKAVIKIQSVARRFLVRKGNVLGKRRNAWVAKGLSNVIKLQAQFMKYSAQQTFHSSSVAFTKKIAAICIQRHWRGWFTRRQYESLSEQSMWPLKSWFNYTPTGPDTCYVDVQFFTNPRFNKRRFDMAYCGLPFLTGTLLELESEIKGCVENYLISVGADPDAVAREAKEKAEAEQREKERLEKEQQEKEREAALALSDSLSSTAPEASANEEATTTEAISQRPFSAIPEEPESAESPSEKARSPSPPEEHHTKQPDKASVERARANTEPSSKSKNTGKKSVSGKEQVAAEAPASSARKSSRKETTGKDQSSAASAAAAPPAKASTVGAVVASTASPGAPAVVAAPAAAPTTPAGTAAVTPATSGATVTAPPTAATAAAAAPVASGATVTAPPTAATAAAVAPVASGATVTAATTAATAAAVAPASGATVTAPGAQSPAAAATAMVPAAAVPAPMAEPAVAASKLSAISSIGESLGQQPSEVAVASSPSWEDLSTLIAHPVSPGVSPGASPKAADVLARFGVAGVTTSARATEIASAETVPVSKEPAAVAAAFPASGTLEPEGEPSGSVKPFGEDAASPQPLGPKFAGPMDATMRKEKSNNVAMVLGGYQAHAEQEASTEPRKPYAGTYVNGKFQKSKATTLNDLSEEERQSVLADMQADREKRAQQLRRKKIEQAMKKQLDGKRAKAKKMGNTQGQFAEEFGAQNAQQERQRKAQAMAHALAKAERRQEEFDKLEMATGMAAATRDRRVNIQQKRMQQQQQIGMKGGYPATRTQESFPNAGGALHRHIHHHMHYHSEGDDETAARSGGERLPQLATDGFRGGMHPGIRRHQSEVIVGTAGPSSNGYTALVHSSSSGQVLPRIAGRPPLGRGDGGWQGAGGGAPRMRATVAGTGMR